MESQNWDTAEYSFETWRLTKRQTAGDRLKTTRCQRLRILLNGISWKHLVRRKLQQRTPQQSISHYCLKCL